MGNSPAKKTFLLQEVRAEEEGEVRIVAPKVHGEHPRVGTGDGEGKMLAVITFAIRS